MQAMTQSVIKFLSSTFDSFLKNFGSKESMKCINAMGGIMEERKSILVQELKEEKQLISFC